MKVNWKISFVLGFLSAFCASSFYKYFDKIFYFIMQDKFDIYGHLVSDGKVDYSTFYKLGTFSATCYTYTIFILVKEYIKNIWWSIFSLVVFLTAFNSFLDEILFDPTITSINEYIGFGITILLVYIFKHKWTK